MSDTDSEKNNVENPENQEEVVSSGDNLEATSEVETSSSGGLSSAVNNIERVMDIDLELTVKIGDLDMKLKDVLDLGPGSIIEVERNADAPLDLLVGKKVLAKGEVVTIGENLGLRITKKR